MKPTKVSGRAAAVRWWCVAMAVCVSLLLAACRTDAREPMVLQPVRPVVWQDFLGVNAHFLWFTPQVYRQQMDRVQSLGLQWVRVDLHWDTIEPEAGVIRWDVLDPLMAEIERRGLKAEVYLVGSAPHATSAPKGAPFQDQYPPRDPQDYARSLVHLAQRYPQVAAWQIWNEPNLPAFWRPREDPAAYGQLLKVAVEAMRSQAPGRELVLGGMAYYSQMPTRGGGLMIEEMGKQGMFALDVVTAYHPYSLHPEGDDPHALDFVHRARQGNAALRAAGARQIWADEWGWSSYSGPTEEQPIIGVDGQADYVLRRLALMSALDYDKIFLFALSDLDSRASPRDRGYGLLNEQAAPKPVFEALQRLLAITGPRLQPGRAPVMTSPLPGLISIPWRHGDGRNLWMFWGEAEATVQLQGIEQATLHDVFSGDKQVLRAGSQGLQVPVGTRLGVLEW